MYLWETVQHRTTPTDILSIFSTIKSELKTLPNIDPRRFAQRPPSVPQSQSSCVPMASISVKTPCHTHFKRISVQLWAGGKTLFYIMRFCVWAVSERTHGSLNEMFTQIPHPPPRGHTIKDDTSILWVVVEHKQQWKSARMLCSIYCVSSGLITTDNYCHSCQLWDKMKLCPTFTFS